ncbi:7tm Odorant receptor [Popillia japonica]|uniref:Odorant receptor n=1 Tax=Popillia japonica TaxID=7064 RepID=A0AAW1K1Q2_POPJA
MALARKLRSFFYRFEYYRREKANVEDDAKVSTFLAEKVISIVRLWPSDLKNWNKIYGTFVLAIVILHLSAWIASLIVNSHNVDDFLGILSSMGPSIQTLAKASVLYSKRYSLAKLIKTVRNEFWPSNLMDVETKTIIIKDTNEVLINTLTEYVAAFTSRVMLIVVRLLENDRELLCYIWLPFDYTKTPAYQIMYLIQAYVTTFLCYIWLPFDYTKTPAYQIMYLIQAYVTTFIDVTVVVGYDMMYGSICSNCIAQFHLLNAAVKYIGTGKEEEIIEKISRVDESVYEIKEKNLEKKLFVICVRKHQKLLRISQDLNKIFGNGHFFQFCTTLIGIEKFIQFCRISQDLNKIFGNGHFFQFCTTLIGICPTLYLITKDVGFDQYFMLIAFYLAHLFELFIFCSVSNQLTYVGICLSEAAYHSLWYNKYSKDLAQCLLIMMIRAQEPISMNAFGLFELNYVTFVAVIRFSFSLYTYLGKMAN